MTQGRTAPVSLYSIAFAFDGAGDAILLRDERDDLLVGGTPEWTAAAGSRALAAYARGAKPAIHVVLARPRNSASPGDREADALEGGCTVWATGAGGPGIEPLTIPLQADAEGFTPPLAFRLERLPDASGVLDVSWSWRARVGSEEFAIGTSKHKICLTAGRPRDPAAWLGLRHPERVGLDAKGLPWTYSRIVEWTCEWAAGLEDDKAIVDAILWHLPRSGLKYAVHLEHNSVREMLFWGGGFCGAWARMFQAMAASQGVFVERRSFWVDWRLHRALERECWCALVIGEGGVNRTEPNWDSNTWHDGDWPFDGKTVRDFTAKRYVFWGSPNKLVDGHTINVLSRSDGSHYLYDPSFVLGPILLDRPLPASDPKKRVDVADLGTFGTHYLGSYEAYLLGVLPRASHASAGPVAKGPAHPRGDPLADGVTIPAGRLAPHRDALTFFWT